MGNSYTLLHHWPLFLHASNVYFLSDDPYHLAQEGCDGRTDRQIDGRTKYVHICYHASCYIPCLYIDSKLRYFCGRALFPSSGNILTTSAFFTSWPDGQTRQWWLLFKKYRSSDVNLTDRSLVTVDYKPPFLPFFSKSADLAYTHQYVYTHNYM